VSGAGISVETNGAGRLGALFGLSAADADLLQQASSEVLEEAGIDASRFFARLRQGDSIGAALGLPPALVELIYARAHRWFLVDRPDRAEPLFRALCSADGTVADYWIGLGLCLRLRRDMDGAAVAFAMASRLRPDWAVPAFHGAELALQRKDHAMAASEIARFRRLAGADIPERMTTEVARMEQALAAQRTRQGTGTGA
jgi:hypothetical protein